MAKRQVVILGAGAAARYVAYVLSYDKNVEVIGFTEQQSDKWNTSVYGKPVLGFDDVLGDLRKTGLRHAVIGIGNPQIRSKLARVVNDFDIELVNAIHPTAILSPSVKIGKGVVIEAGSVLSDNPVLEDNVWIGLAAMVSHDTRIGRSSSIGGRAAVGADVNIAEQVMVGMGSVIQSGKKIGMAAIVGSGANVVHDVPEYAIVVGNPAKVIKYRDIQ